MQNRGELGQHFRHQVRVILFFDFGPYGLALRPLLRWQLVHVVDLPSISVMYCVAALSRPAS